MPISLRPKEERTWWLPGDAEIPYDQRPMFLCEAPVATLTLRHRELRDKAEGLQGQALLDLMVQMISLGVSGWVNFGDRAFSPAALPEILCEDELVDLAYGWPDAHAMTEEDRKNSQSPSRSDTGTSAPTAAAASASNLPTPTSPHSCPSAGAPTASACPSCPPPAEPAEAKASRS